MIQTSPGTLTAAILVGAPAGLAITARLVDGDETLPIAVTVTPILDSSGDPLNAYRATFTPTVLPVIIEWLQDAITVVGSEIVQDLLVTTPLDPGDVLAAFRLELGDTDPANLLFTDQEATYFLDQRPDSLLLAVADAAGALALRYARKADVAQGGRSFAMSQIAKAYADQESRLRARVGNEAAAQAAASATDATVVNPYDYALFDISDVLHGLPVWPAR